jgi:hypothetical protein
MLQKGDRKQPKEYAFQSDWLYTDGSVDKRDRLFILWAPLFLNEIDFDFVEFAVLNSLSCFPQGIIFILPIRR